MRPWFLPAWPVLSAPLVCSGRSASRTPRALLLAVLLALLLPLLAPPARAAPGDDTHSFEWRQHLGAALPLELRFTDAAGRSAPLARRFGSAPVLIVLGHLRCSHLCGTTLVGAREALARAQAGLGTPVRALFVSLDPADPLDGLDARRVPDGWQVLGAPEATVRALAEAIGFPYAWDARVQQYIHPAGFVVATPAGTVSRYFPGVRFDAQRLHAALAEAAQGRTGSPAERLLLLCRHLLPVGEHGAAILLALRGAALALLAAIAALAWRAGRRR